MAVIGFLAVLAAFAGRGVPPEPLLDWLYHGECSRPVEYWGYAFTDTPEEMAQMTAEGANAVGTGLMWVPVHGKGPFGLSHRPAGLREAGMPLGQRFTAARPFDCVSVTMPTWVTSGSGCTLTLYRCSGEDLRAALVAARRIADAVDNAWNSLELPPQPPGQYYWEIDEPVGEAIGVWATRNSEGQGGGAVIGGRPVPEADFVFKALSPGTVVAEPPDQGEHFSVALRPDLFAFLHSQGIVTNFMIGNWNNGFFPYYPDWFYKEFPDAWEVDQDGRRVEANMFGKPMGWPSIHAAVIAEGTKPFIRHYVSDLRREPSLLYWVMGGESLYATFAWPGRWTDFSPEALPHFRGWLTTRYGAVDQLNRTWARDFASMDAVEPPRTPSVDRPRLDWLEFRFQAMAERFRYHYQSILAEDKGRLAFTCNHGSIFSGPQYAAMGWNPEYYASVSDGFETGQIIEGQDHQLYNLQYMQTLAALGKPVAPARLAYKFPDPKARGGGTSFTPVAARRYLYECLGTGAWHVGLIQWRGSLPDGEWGVKGTTAQEETRRLFAEMKMLEGPLEGMYAVRPRLAVWRSHERWALLGWPESWTQLHRALARNQLPVSYLSNAALRSPELRLYDVLLSLDNDLVGPDEAELLAQYVRQGGTLLIAGEFGAKALDAEPGWGRARELLGQSTRLGSGPVRVLESDWLPRLLAILSERGCRPVSVSGTSARARVRGGETVAESRHDLPADFHDYQSLGQTFEVPAGRLVQVALQTPTWYGQPMTGLHATLRQQGPAGAVLAEAEIPADKISDNAWAEMPVSLEFGQRTRLYLEVSLAATTAAQQIGWWTAEADIYACGQAFADGEPVAGDRAVSLTWEEDLPAHEAVEAFLLSDGANLCALLIGLSETPLDLEVSLSPTWVPRPNDEYALRELLSGKGLGSAKGDRLNARVTLQPHGVALVCAEVAGQAQECRARASRLRERLSALESRGCLTGYLRTTRDRLDRSLAEERWAKALAFADCLESQLGLRVRLRGRELTVALRNLQGKPLEGAQVWAELVPTIGNNVVRLQELGGGRYSLALSPAVLGSIYDYPRRTYRPFSGPLRVNVFARAGRLRGQQTVFLTIKA